MKKILSALLVLTICVSQLSVVSVASYDDTDCLSVDKFAGKLVELINESDKLVEFSDSAGLHYSNADGAEIDVDEPESSTLRLIVKSEEKLPELDSVGYIYGYNDLHILQFDNRESLEKAKEYYTSLSCVEYVEEDGYIHEAVVDDGNDMIFETAVEYPTAVQSGIFGYATAKAESDGFDVDIAVIDSGVEINHDFLAGRVVDSGVDVINNSGTANDDRGHGTHVAGIIVANTLSNVTVHAYKALNSSGTGTASQISLAIDAAIEDEVDIINLSMSMKGTNSTLKNAVQRAYSEGICVIVAAGNNSTNITNTSYSPASFDECITVMSCSNAKKILDTSNYGSPCDFAAPGENILSTYIGNCYKLSTGTSMAAPFICAAAAYLLAKDDTLTPEEIRTALGQNVEDCVDTPTGKCVIPSTKIPIDDFASAPQFITCSGEFIGSIYVEIDGSDDADIYYYLNNNSQIYRLYTEPILITETTKISAFTVQVGKVNSVTKSATFTKLDYESDSDYVIVDNTLVAYNGTQASVNVPISFYGKTIYTIGPNAFKDNKNITDITIDTSINEIGESAFAGCESLLNISAPQVKYIRDGAFENCTQLKNVSFSNVEYIGERAFMNTTALTTFGAPLIKTIGAYAFNGSGISSATISNAQTIGDYAFANCTNLSSIIVSVTEIGEGAFVSCSKLTQISALNLKVIPSYCFQQCTLIEDFDFPLVTVVDASAFEGCISIRSFDFPALTTVKERAFASTGLTSVESDSITSFSPDSFADCLNITQISLGGMEKVDFKDFAACEKLTKLILSNAKEIICPEGGLNVIFPNLKTFNGGKIVSLPDRAFAGCSKLCSAYLPNVKSIGAYAFQGCQALASSDNYSFYAEEIGVGAFDGISGLSRLTLVNLKELNCNIFGSSATRITTLNMPSLESISNFSLSTLTTLINLNLDSYKNIDENTFADCSKIKTLSLNSLEDISSVSFSTIPNLEKFTAKSLTEIPAKAFYNNTILKSLTLGSVTKIGASAFEGCSVLSYVDNGATPVELEEKAFYGCNNFSVKTIYSDSVTYIFGSLKIKTLGSYALRGTKSGWSSAVFDELVRVDENGFADIYCQNAIFEKVEVMHDVPENGNVLIGSMITDFSVDAANTSTIYSPAGTVASDYCIANGVNYLEFNETNPIISNTNKTVSSQDELLIFRALGFNLEYNWYACNNEDMSDSVFKSSDVICYVPLSYDDDKGEYKYYYCVASSTENGNVVNIRSNLVRNTFTYVAAKNDKTEIDYTNGYIFTDEKDIDAVKSNIHFEEGCCEFVPSISDNNVNLYGTGSSVNAYVNGKLKHSYILIIDGDVNGDGYVDVLDCANVADVVNGHSEIADENCFKAASYVNDDGIINIDDYQAIVNKAVS